MQESVPAELLGVPGEFLPAGQDIVPPRLLRVDAAGLQGPDHRNGEGPEIHLALHIRNDKGKIQIAQVVIDGAAAGVPPDHFDALFTDIVVADLLQRVLVFAYDDRRRILPQKQDRLAVIRPGEDVFLEGQIVGRIGTVVFDIDHGDIPFLIP